MSQKQTSFACDRCRAGKRKCDAARPACSLCSRQNRECVYTEQRPRKRKYWDEDYVRALEAQVQSLLLALEKQGAESEPSPAALSLSDRASRSVEPDAGLGEDVAGGDAVDEEDEEEEAEEENFVSGNHTNTTATTAANNVFSLGDGRVATGKGPGAMTATTTTTTTTQERSQAAMEELCVMLWRTNVGDGVTIIDDPKTGSRYSVDPVLQQPAPAPAPAPSQPPPAHHRAAVVTPPEQILAYCRQQGLVHEMADLFLANINREHQFTPYTTTADFLPGYPYQAPDEAFLHSAIIATGTAFSSRPDARVVGDAFAEFAEGLVLTCCRQNPTVRVIQGLSMMSWRSLALGRDHFGWMFISMAAGMCVHLRLHVLALDECTARQLEATEQEVRTFWMFYIIDRTAISILGRNCALPWRRVNVPSFDTTFESSTADLAQVSFAWQCRLWYLQDQYMDQVFSTTFESLPIPQQVRVLVASQDALSTFFRSRDDRLHLSGDSTPKPHHHHHPQNSEFMLLVLRSLTAAATATSRLARTYRRAHGFDTPPNPVLIHHLLSAAIVHLMNATSWTPALRHQSTYWLRQCLELLRELQTPWPVRAIKSIKIIRVLAQRWGVVRALPLEFSYQVEPPPAPPAPAAAAAAAMAPEAQDDYGVEAMRRSGAAAAAGGVLGLDQGAVDQVQLEYEWDGYAAGGNAVDAPAMDLGALGVESFAAMGGLDMSALGGERANAVGGAIDFLQAFQGLTDCDNFNWLSTNNSNNGL
ncbi:Nitrogen assimilation transcription factor nit-4 [Colletotrichum higginsianum]|uniref:Nitrogen assimilation transcription factor nit-4 n=1 Tax=Colletotrichum higginsianum TaxID=80884 RepID=A0A4T0VRP3_9PEZI|nr:Nitrogen assimilation transcription factor nit-4 [Colletotrichum higginsianum]